MKKLFLLFFVLGCLWNVNSIAQSSDNGDGTFTNPVLWADVPDPDVIRVGDDYYMVSTTMHLMPGAPIMHSKDLVNWEIINYLYDRLDDKPSYGLIDGTVYGRGQWATSLKYHNGKFYAYFAIAYAGDCQLDFGNTVRINAGKPRSGKTSNAVHDGRILALKMWERLQYDFWDWHSREPEILARNDKDELLQYYEIKISYNFYVMRPCIPCLWSNIGIEDDRGYRCHKVTLAHLRGIERLPLYSVVVLDEIGAVLKAELSNDREGRPYDVSDMFRLGGPFLKWVVIACEQDFNNIYIDCRRVVGFNQLISGQEWVCRSGLLCGIYNFFKFIISDAMQKKQKRRPKLAHFMHGFERFVRSIGFRSYKLAYVSNTQTDAAISGASEDQKAMKIDGKARRIVPSSLAARYDDRAYKQLYPSYFDKEIKGELHPALHIRGTDTKYGRQFVNTSKAIEEKRGAIDELVQGLNAAAGGCSFNGGGVERRRKNRGKKNMP